MVSCSGGLPLLQALNSLPAGGLVGQPVGVGAVQPGRAHGLVGVHHDAAAAPFLGHPDVVFTIHCPSWCSPRGMIRPT